LSGWPDLTHVPSALADEGKIPDSDSQSDSDSRSDSDPQTEKAPFLPAQWSELAPSFGLPEDLWRARLDEFSIATVFLPLSFHEATAKAAWHIQDVFLEPTSIDRDEAGARARTLDAVRPVLVEFVLCLYITPSTLSQLWDYSKAALLISRSVPQCQQLTLVEVRLSIR
jgi:hypothetical protein